MEYIAAEVLESAGLVCRESKRKTLAPRHVELAVINDNDLARLF